MSNENAISSHIKELRTSLKLTQNQFAETLNISTVSVSSYETGAKTPSLDMVINIAQKYNVSLDWLCGLSDKSPSTSIVSTYADIIEMLTAIVDNSNLNIEITFDAPSNYNSDGIINFSVVPPQLGTIRFNDSKITTFLHEWQDMLRLLKNGTIKKSLFELWLKDQLEKYNEPITEENRICDTDFTETLQSSDDTLPFS